MRFVFYGFFICIYLFLQIGFLHAQSEKRPNKDQAVSISVEKKDRSSLAKPMRKEIVSKEKVSTTRVKQLSQANKSSTKSTSNNQIQIIEQQISHLEELLAKAESNPKQYSKAYIAKFSEALVEKRKALEILKSNIK